MSVYRFLSQKILRMETRVNSSAFFSFTENRRSIKSLPSLGKKGDAYLLSEKHKLLYVPFLFTHSSP